MRQRSKARAWALQVLYAWEARGDAPLDVVLEEFLARRRIAPARRPYLRRLIENVADELDTVDDALRAVVTNWRLDRLSVIDRNILRLGAVELLRFDDVPPRVSIQEALRLAERYGTDQSPRFVNGVLDALMKRLDGA
ncbi:MAG: transcription antitermination factor NusB [Gemmatimonadetes bacterium]|nr:transcription antitermination factor NusB [Gemmatimonadota bacterium]NIQ60163.1 transcription antitermination factor NusB [Gemmatimonadota bacterium]NIU80379.1 transcription antitermination factor NusB [Gammaproteobacteria bacterium]NIX48723.1 transcription antitermination factor NusB [Gemmatimonadota bacterium]NIY13174.1 transcription antitermination factor NusB [Gemmatimonadota bacterium]